jgi:hypothetical protein
MTGLSMAASRALAEQFPWGQYQTFVDVGTAQGGLPVQLALAHGHLSGGGFDMPPVRPIFEAYVRSYGLHDRLRFYPGDFFTDPLPAADVLIMGQILHGWNLEEKHLLLDKAYAALPSGGALIVLDTLIDEERRENVFGLLMSLNMLIESPGGFEYTGTDCVGWMQETGFRQTRVEHVSGPHSVVIGIK